jgi:hypothetical protein
MIASVVNNKTVFRRLLSLSRRRVTGDRTASRLDPSPSPLDPITKYFMLLLFPVFHGVPLSFNFKAKYSKLKAKKGVNLS